MSKYDETVRQEKEVAKKIAIEDVKKWIEKMPKEDRDKPTILAGDKVFTPNQLLAEVEKETEHGIALQNKLSRLRLELSKKGV